MYSECLNVSQFPGEPARRCFRSGDWDLVVWCEPTGEALGFQLCYPTGTATMALTWLPEQGLSHRSVDDGERSNGKYLAAPILVPTETIISVQPLLHQFRQDAVSLPAEFAEFVLSKLVPLA